MKKIQAISFFVLLAFLFSCSVLHPVKKYQNDFGGLQLKPVNVDTTKISDAKKYFLEGSLDNGDMIIIRTSAENLKKIMRIPWPENGALGDVIRGYRFTINYLGQESYLTKKDIDSSDAYDNSQKEFLMRNRKAEKYELVSALPYPAAWVIEGKKLVLITDVAKIPQNNAIKDSVIDWTRGVRQ